MSSERVTGRARKEQKPVRLEGPLALEERALLAGATALDNTPPPAAEIAPKIESTPITADAADGTRARAARSAPTIRSIGGYTSSAAGITNGRVDMTIGTKWNGHLAVNDRAEIYYWTITGSNFGTARGSVRLAGRTVPVQSWSNTQIRIQPSGTQINPSQPWNWGPMSTTLEVRTADNRVATQGVSIVPAIRTRVFEQCTWHVAKRRIEMGLNPSPTAYNNYSAITPSWVPRRGDQLKWGGTPAAGGTHQAIIESVSRSTSSDGRTTFSIQISQYNAAGNNEFNAFTTTLVVRNGTVLTLPRYSATSGGATGWFR